MDRSRYQPGDTVKVRTVSVQLDNHPYKGRVQISLQDPGGNIADRRESTVVLGIVLQEFSLSQTSPLGLWAVTTSVNGVTEKKTFTVEHYETPHFEVLVITPPQVLDGEDVSGSVRALYPSGQPVLATSVVSVTLAHDMSNVTSPVIQTQIKKIYGSGKFFFSKDQLQSLYTLSRSGNNRRLHVTACVTSNDGPAEVSVNKTVEVQLTHNIFQLAFQDFPATLKPSLYFSANLRISRYDRQPLTSQDRMYFAVVEVTQRSSTTNAEPTTLTLQVPEDGNVHIRFLLLDQVDMLFIQATFQSTEETLTVYNNYSSPTGSYIQISPSNIISAQIGFPVQIIVESTFQPTAFHFVVSSRGQVVAAGTNNSMLFSLTPEMSWSPEACVTVYCILSNGEVVSDTARILINQQNYLSLNWSSNEARPGEQVSLSVTTLEPRSQVGIMIMAMRDETPEHGQGLTVKQKCNVRTLTNAILYNKNQSDGTKNETLSVDAHWSHWMDVNESLLWLDANISDGTWRSGQITVPDGVTSLKAVGLVMSDNLGLGFTPVPQKLTVSKDFSMSLSVPSFLIRGEEIVLEVNVVNHLDRAIEVIVLLTQSKAFQFVLVNSRNVSVINAQKLNLGSHKSAAALFPIRPVAVGEMEITVYAVSADTSDSLFWSVFVKPEGVEQYFSESLFLELEPGTSNSFRSFSFSFPSNVVPGSQRAYAALVGDILGLSMSNLDSLVQVPLGCGEQNMIQLAPSIYVLQYLDKSTQDNKEIRSRALGYMTEGYLRQLSYQRDDGSFSAFGASDTSGSIWLTAFVLRCFIQAQTYINVDQNVLTNAMTWLLKYQGPQGEFNEVGRLIHTEMQGAQDDGSVALSAYVLIALLEDETYLGTYLGNVSQAQKYLENKVSSGIASNYTLCLVAYALTLANSPVAADVLTELYRRADYTDDVMMWRSSTGLEANDGRVQSKQIEMVSYVLLVLFRRGSLVEGITLLKWLSQQRSHLGGYGTTQDTVVALQALAYYAAFSGANAIDLRLNISSPTFSFLFSINSTNYWMYQSQEINVDKDLHLTTYMEGRGFALFQMNIFYSLETNVFSQHHATDKEAFSLAVNVTKEGDLHHLLLSICTRLKDSQGISYTGMVILDVGILSGFILSPGSAATTDLIRKVEILPEKVSLYLDSLNKSQVCIRLPVVRKYKVARVQDAVVQVYDYYEPTRRATRTYNLDVLRNMDSCDFCGANCDRCRPKITIVSSISSATYSLSVLLLGITLFTFFTFSN
uniref:CD109 molecule n=2 Tax=Anabas testudineus TaxID=64144 RepID=A0A3Q1HW22_ANATE